MRSYLYHLLSSLWDTIHLHVESFHCSSKTQFMHQNLLLMASTTTIQQFAINLGLHLLHHMHSEHLHLFIQFFSVFIVLSYLPSACAIRHSSHMSVTKRPGILPGTNKYDLDPNLQM